MRHKNLHTTIILTFIFISLTINTKAQFVDLGQDPASVKWRQIKTENFQVIYPDFYEEKAQFIANIYHKLYQHNNTLGITPKKMSMIIRANGGISNGNAGWAPKKSELYTTPSQDADDPWLEHLCIHEFRHIVQFDKINQGFTKALYYIFGEQAVMAVVGVYLPMWYIEGDAVSFESAMTNGGRGRSPEFINEMKSQIIEEGIYSYDKAVLGSYKDYIPNRYTMGYFMVANSQKNYGPQIWQNALTRTGKRSYGVTPFSKSINLTLNQKRDSVLNAIKFESLEVTSTQNKHRYKDGKKTLYHDNFNELYITWKQEADQIQNHFDTIPTANKVYTNYHYPTPTENGDIIAYKEGLDHEGMFVRISEHGEEIITRTGIVYDYKFAYNKSTIVWTEYRPHPRWEHGGKMVLASYNLKTKEYKRIRHNANRFAPFPVENAWGFVEVDKVNNASIVILDQDLKTELYKINARNDELFVHPFYDKQDNIYTIVVDKQGKYIDKIDLKTKRRQTVSPVTNYEIDNPIAINDDIIYRAAYNTNNSLYKTTNNQTTQIVNAKFGVSYPYYSPQNDSLYFSFYTSKGFKPAKINRKNFLNNDIDFQEFTLAQDMAKQESKQFSTEQDTTFASKKYNKTTHLLNFHSWGPIFPDADDSEIDFGLAVSSQNKLSTLYFTAGYVKESDYPNGNWRLKGTYKAWWPVFQVEFRNGDYGKIGRYDYNATNKQTHQRDTVAMILGSRHTKLETTVQLPFNLMRKNYYRSITPYVKYELQSIHNLKLKDFYVYTPQGLVETNPSQYDFSDTRNITLQVMRYGLILSNQTRMNQRDLYPRWSQRLSGGYKHTPFENLDYGNMWWAEGRFYVPGLFKHHSLYAYIGHQQTSEGYNYLGNQILFPRGVSSSRIKEVTTLRTSYYLPIAYPDFSIGPLVYFKRISGGIFFDAGWEKNNYIDISFQSFGIEMNADSHALRLLFPINIGFRAGYETLTKSAFFDVLMNINFSF